MIDTQRRVAQLILLTSALCVAGAATAALKDAPPEGLTLSGTEWQLDPTHSDDPAAVIERAEQNAQEERADRDRGALDRGGMDRGVLDRDDDTRGSSFPDRTSRSGGWGHDQGNTSTTMDPWGGKQSASIQLGSRGGGRNPHLGQLARNPESLEFVQAEKYLKVTEDRLETECTAGAKMPISDSYGDGERRCGWNGRAFVIETKRGSLFSRTDRYELSKDGKTLKYVTTASGKGMPDVRISRTYEVARRSN